MRNCHMERIDALRGCWTKFSKTAPKTSRNLVTGRSEISRNLVTGRSQISRNLGTGAPQIPVTRLRDQAFFRNQITENTSETARKRQIINYKESPVFMVKFPTK